MNESTQREKLIKEGQALQEIIDEHQYEIETLSANIKEVNKLIADFDAGIDSTPWDTYKVLYNLDQDNDFKSQ